MVRIKRPDSQTIQGGINITGNVKIKNSKIAGRDNVEKNVVNIDISFTPIYHALKKSEKLSPTAKKTVEKNVKQIEQEIKKGDKAKASFIQERLKNIQKMAPDIAEVIITTLQNPALGISIAIKKVIKKFKTE